MSQDQLRWHIAINRLSCLLNTALHTGPVSDGYQWRYLILDCPENLGNGERGNRDEDHIPLTQLTGNLRKIHVGTVNNSQRYGFCTDRFTPRNPNDFPTAAASLETCCQAAANQANADHDESVNALPAVRSGGNSHEKLKNRFRV